MFEKIKKLFGLTEDKSPAEFQNETALKTENAPKTIETQTEDNRKKEKTTENETVENSKTPKENNFVVHTTERPEGNLYEIDDKQRGITFVLDIQCKAGDEKIPLCGKPVIVTGGFPDMSGEMIPETIEDNSYNHRYFIEDGIVKRIDCYDHDLGEYDVVELGKLTMSASLSVKKGDVFDEKFRHEIEATQNNLHGKPKYDNNADLFEISKDGISTSDIALILYNNIKDAAKPSYLDKVGIDYSLGRGNSRYSRGEKLRKYGSKYARHETAKLLQGFLQLVNDPIMNAPNLKRLEKLKKGIKLHGFLYHDKYQNTVHSESELKENRVKIKEHKGDYEQRKTQARLERETAAKQKAEKTAQDKQFLSSVVKDLKAADLFK